MNKNAIIILSDINIARFLIDDEKIKIQTIKEHTDNVVNLISLNLQNLELNSFLKMVAILHDLGKYSDDFQNYIRTAIEKENDGSYEQWIKRVEKHDHGVYGALYIEKKIVINSPLEKIVSDIMKMVICYHHGGLNDCVNSEYSVPLYKRFEKCNDVIPDSIIDRFNKDYNKNMQQLFSEACSEFNSLSKKLFIFNKERSFILHLIIKLIYSALIDADRTDAYLFEAETEIKPIELSNKIDEYIKLLDNKINQFSLVKTNSKFMQAVNEIRSSISRDCLISADKEQGIYKLTVPTGGGKTLSSLRFALHHAKKRNLNRIIYILPYTTIIEQNASVVRDALKCNDELLEYHCNVINDSNEQNDLLTQNWNYPIIYTTMVQYLNSFFSKSTQDIRRIRNFCNSVIVFDEIQKIPTKCISLFNSTINFLSKICNCTIVLSSATQPTLCDTDTPIYMENNNELISNVDKCFESLKRMNVQNRIIPGGYSYQMAANFIKDLSKENNSVLCIVNTIKSAEEIYDYILERNNDFKLYFLSTHLCPENRKKVINEIKDNLIKNIKMVCISTPLIEAGVDISFDTVFRSLCGLDSIAQATGRANRNGEKEVGNSYIINLKDENISPLTEVEVGAKHCHTVLEEFKGQDVLMPKANDRYFHLYYNDKKIKSQMNYKIHNDESIFEMLSCNKVRDDNYKAYNNSNIPISINYRFKTAAENFQVIENNTKSIIVPFEEGENIICKLLSKTTVKDKYLLIKEAQKYIVNVYDNLFNELNKENALMTCDIEGVYLLNKAFYNKEKGVCVKKNLELLNY